MRSVSASLHSEKGFVVISQKAHSITWANDRWWVRASISGNSPDIEVLGIKIERNAPYRRLQNETVEKRKELGWRG